MILHSSYSKENECTLYNGDCFDLLRMIGDEEVDLVVSSPPYCIGKSYEKIAGRFQVACTRG